MYKYKNDIYDLCTNTTQKAIDLFCNEINNSDADVFVVMAHKAVLLFQVLLEQNHIIADIVANKIIITNQALDFECSYLQGKRISIVDDIVISGTSIATVVNKLLSIGISQRDVSIIALATDKHYLSMNFVNTDGQSALRCNTVLEDATCIELSSFISKTFAYYGMPYNIDFPIYKSIKLSEERINLFFNDFLWKTDKFSNVYQKDNNVDYYILFPRKSVRELLWNRIGANLEECVHLKIRIYTIHYPSGKKECHIMPLCLFNGITEENLNKLYNLFKPAGQEITLNKILEEIDRFVPKMRYVQFYIAHQLYLIFNDITSLGNDVKPLENSTYLLFGLNDGVKIYNTLNDIGKNHATDICIGTKKYINNVLIDEYLSSDMAKKVHENAAEFMKQNEKIQGYLINRIILSPFLWWYDEKEITVRNELIRKPKHYIKNFEEIKNMTNRLNSGFSLPTLQAITNNVIFDSESEIVISLFLDRSIDEGIIVPTIYHNKKNHFLCRAYRHGEDLPFGIADECRLLYFLKQLSQQIPNVDNSINNECLEGIAQVSMEKMIILFYQMGIKSGDIFNHFLGFDNIRLLKTYLSIHGPVEGFIDPIEIKNKNIEEHIYSEKDDNGYEYITWLTKWLLTNNFIKCNYIRKKNIYTINRDYINETLNQTERSCMSEVIKNKISNIANMISVWYNSMAKNRRKNDFKINATALTSCSDAFVYASAIATEIHYFSRFWEKQVLENFNKSHDVYDLIQMFTSMDYDRNRTLNIEQALHSGRSKVMWFESEKASKVVNEVYNILNTNGANIWIEIWEDVKSAKYKVNNLLQMYIDQAVGFLYFFSACYDCLVFKAFWESEAFPKEYTVYKSNYEIQCQKTELLEKNLFVQLDKVMLLSDFSQKKLEFNKLVQRSLVNSEDSVDNIELEIEKNSSNYTIQYKSALIFDVRALNGATVENIIMDVWNQLDDIDLKTQSNIISFPDNLLEQGFMRYGFFYNISSKSNKSNPLLCGEVLINVYNKLCKAFNGAVYEIRAIMLPDIPPGRMYKHNVQKNIKKYAQKFDCDIIEPLKECFVKETRQQLILAMTDYVDLKFYDKIIDMEWDNSINFEKLSNEKIFSNVTTYYNRYIHPENTQKKDVTYSIVKVLCEKKWGTGFLIRTSNHIVCITCNHVLVTDEQCQITAVSSYADTTKFIISPIKKIISCDYTKEVLEAEDEVAILKPQWDGRIPYDIDSILSLEDLNAAVDCKTAINCSCCGYPNIESHDYSWSDCLQTCLRRMARGYYETTIDSNKENLVGAGYSGGIILFDNDSNGIIGIHEGRKDNKGRMISCSTIKAALRKELLK